MPVVEDDMETSNGEILKLSRRLERLETQTRRLRQSTFVALILVCAVFIMGQSLPGTGIIEAEKFVLRDKNKVRRAELTMNEYGNPGLYLYPPLPSEFLKLPPGLADSLGTPDAAFEISSEGMPHLMLFHSFNYADLRLSKEGGAVLSFIGGSTMVTKEGKLERKPAGSVFLAVGSDGVPKLSLTNKDSTRQAELTFSDKDQPVLGFLSRTNVFDRDRKAMAVFGITDEGAPLLALNDKNGNQRASIALASDDRPFIRLKDAEGKQEVSLSVEDKSMILFVDKNAKVRAALGVTESSAPTLILQDATGEARADLSLGEDGTPSFTTYDAQGNAQQSNIASAIPNDAREVGRVWVLWKQTLLSGLKGELNPVALAVRAWPSQSECEKVRNQAQQEANKEKQPALYACLPDSVNLQGKR